MKKYAHDSRRGLVWTEGSAACDASESPQNGGASHLNDLLTCTMAAL